MPLDRPNRTRAATAIVAYLRSEIDNFRLDEETLDLKTSDRTLVKVSCKIWHFYDDIRRHLIHASPEAWDYLVRCIAYLRTDIVDLGDYEDLPNAAPFPSNELWLSNQHLIEPDHLPTYDPEKHQQKRYLDPQYRLRDVAIAIGFILLIIFLVT